jgi:hypothetical protein
VSGMEMIELITLHPMKWRVMHSVNVSFTF